MIQGALEHNHCNQCAAAKQLGIHRNTLQRKMVAYAVGGARPLAYFVVVVVGPAVAANGVASEREGRTWEAVQLTGLTAKDVARGKFVAAYTTIALYIVV